MDMLTKANEIKDEIVRLRRDIHAHPELGFEEVRTAKLVADTLREIGMEVTEGVGRTGVVGQLGAGTGPTIAIRADMDALPIEQESDAPYKSTVPGVMHACGHDAHTAMLLGVAHLLKQSLATEKWQGNVRFLFQPSEEAWGEDGISGATAMINDDAMNGVDAVIALHVNSLKETGELNFADGIALSAVDSFEAWIRATGSHGASPHKGTDANYMLSHVLPALYAIPSRMIDPLQPTVVSVGRIESGNATNVIPAEVYVNGTIRSRDEGVREQLWAEIERAFALAEHFGGSSEVVIHKGYIAMENDVGVNDWMRDVVSDFGLADGIVNKTFGMGGEDFAYMTKAARGAMFMLGAATKDGVMRGHHTPLFDIDEDALPVGTAVLAETARRFVLGEVGKE